MFEQIAEKMKTLRGVIANVEKQFGKGAIMSLGDEADIEPIATIRTGSLALDLATGIGGYPRGRVVEVYGPESSGKTTLALHAIAEAQRAGGVCAFIDAEHALDVAYARRHRRRDRQAPRLATRHWRAGARHLRDARPLGRRRPHRRRLGRRAHAARRARG